MVPDSSGDYRMAHHCHTLEEYRRTLEDIYDQQWYAHVPFDSGEALFEGDSSGYVSDVIDGGQSAGVF